MPNGNGSDHTSWDCWPFPAEVALKYKDMGIERLLPWQAECLRLPGVLDGTRNLVYSAPTSAGKTLVAELLMLRRLLPDSSSSSSEPPVGSRKALLVLPYVSVSREKTDSLRRLFSTVGLKVGGFFGGQSPAGGLSSVDLAVCTLEKANSLANRLLEEGRTDLLAAVVVDELHLIGDESRGYLLELFLTKLLFLTRRPGAPACQVIGMSATLPGLDHLSGWLGGRLYSTDYRPVPLRQMAKIGRQLLDCRLEPLGQEDDGTDGPTAALARPDLPGDSDQVAALCLDTVLRGHSVLVFCPTKAWCEQLADSLARIFFGLIRREGSAEGDGLRATLNYEALQEVRSQLQATPAGLDPVLGRTVPFACAFHHAGLTSEEREVLESGFRRHAIRVLVATSTLSAGVNLPARRVLVRTPTFYGRPLDPFVYRQMVGRAGRLGVDTRGESILLCQPHERRAAMELLGDGPLRPLTSCLPTRSLRRAVLEAVASGVAQTRADVEQYIGCSLAASCGLPVLEQVGDTLRQLLDCDLLAKRTDDSLAATNLGCAVLASALGPDEGLQVLTELENARRGLALDTELHLVYLCTPVYCDVTGGSGPDWLLYTDLLHSLTPAEKRVACLVGVSERYIGRRVRQLGPGGRKDEAERLDRLHRRFYTALALADLVAERGLSATSRRFNANRGQLQALQQQAGSYAAMVTVFAARLGWAPLDQLLAQFQSRLCFGVQADLLELIRLPLLDATRARALHRAGLRSVSEVAAARPVDLERLLRQAAPFRTRREAAEVANACAGSEDEDASRVILDAAGRPLSELEAAEAIVEAARQLLREDLVALGVVWDPEKSSGGQQPARPWRRAARQSALVDGDDLLASQAESEPLVVGGSDGDDGGDASGESTAPPVLTEGGADERAAIDAERLEMSQFLDAVCSQRALASQTAAARSQLPDSDLNMSGDQAELSSCEHSSASAASEKSQSADTVQSAPSADVEPTAAEFMAPAAESKAPAAESKAPVAESKASVTESKAPAAESKAPAAESKVPVAESKAPVTESKAPAAESKAPAAEYKAPVAESKAPAAESKAPATESKALATESKALATESKAPVAESDSPVCEFKSSMGESELAPADASSVGSVSTDSAETPGHSGRKRKQPLNLHLRALSRRKREVASKEPPAEAAAEPVRKSTRLLEARSSDAPVGREAAPSRKSRKVLVEQSPEVSAEPDALPEKAKVGSEDTGAVRVAKPVNGTPKSPRVLVEQSPEGSLERVITADNTPEAVGTPKPSRVLVEQSPEMSDSGGSSEAPADKPLELSVAETPELPAGGSAEKPSSPSPVTEAGDRPATQARAPDFKLPEQPADLAVPSQPKQKPESAAPAAQVAPSLDWPEDSFEVNTQLANLCDIGLSGKPIVRLPSAPSAAEKPSPPEDSSNGSDCSEADAVGGYPEENSFVVMDANAVALNVLGDTITQSMLAAIDECSVVKQTAVPAAEVRRVPLPSTPVISSSAATSSPSTPRSILKASAAAAASPALLLSRKRPRPASDLADESAEATADGDAAPDSDEEPIPTPSRKRVRFADQSFPDIESATGGADISLTGLPASPAPAASERAAAADRPGGAVSSTSALPVLPFAVKTVTASEAELSTFMRDTLAVKEFAFALAFEPLDPATNRDENGRPRVIRVGDDPELRLSWPAGRVRCVGVALCLSTDAVHYLDLTGRAVPLRHCLSLLRRKLALAKSLACFHCRRQWAAMARCLGHQLDPDCLVDPGVASWLLDPAGKSHGITAVASRFAPGELQYLDVTHRRLGSVGCRRAVAEAHAAFVLAPRLLSCLATAGLSDAFARLEMPASVLLAKAELNGFRICPAERQRLEARVGSLISYLEARICALAGRRVTLTDTSDLADLLFRQLRLPVCDLGDALGLGLDRQQKQQGCQRQRQPSLHRRHPATDRDALEKLRDLHPIPGLIIDWRRLQCALTRSLQPIREAACAIGESVKVYCEYDTCTVTGRIVTGLPNLQSVPKSFSVTVGADYEPPTLMQLDWSFGEASQTAGSSQTTKGILQSAGSGLQSAGSGLQSAGSGLQSAGSVAKISEISSRAVITQEVSVRRMLIPADGCVLLSADYCQAELRIAAHLSAEPRLLAALARPGADIFRQLTAKWKAKLEDHVTEEERGQTKALCYGLLYGMTPMGLAERLGIDEARAATFQRSFLLQFRGLQRWIDSLVAQVRETGWVATVCGKRRRLPAICHKAPSARAQAERQAVNTAVQGSAADIMKRAMAAIDRELSSQRRCCGLTPHSDCRGAHLLLQMHDELVFEVPAAALTDVARLVRRCMEAAPQLTVPMPVKIRAGSNWADLQELQLD